MTDWETAANIQRSTSNTMLQLKLQNYFEIILKGKNIFHGSRINDRS